MRTSAFNAAEPTRPLPPPPFQPLSLAAAAVAAMHEAAAHRTRPATAARRWRAYTVHRSAAPRSVQCSGGAPFVGSAAWKTR